MNLNATLFAQTVVFLILAWFTMRFVWPPLIKALDERSKKIADGLAAAEKSKAELEMARQHADRTLVQAREEGRQRIAEAEKRAQIAVEEIKRNAQAEATRIVADAKAEAEQQFAKARAALQSEVALLAIKMAEQILKREIDRRTHAELLSQQWN